ncbi:hypothetical protein [Barnesiella intestinihominis]|nr:hypothetical protein [Barnesiella intestinihominis]MDB0679235.1 hypothetical protein [Barnesiella intestinihominis]MDB0684887.1 hypothetical protein [Barnesiella intestinihominis]
MKIIAVAPASIARISAERWIYIAIAVWGCCLSILWVSQDLNVG